MRTPISYETYEAAALGLLALGETNIIIFKVTTVAVGVGAVVTGGWHIIDYGGHKLSTKHPKLKLTIDVVTKLTLRLLLYAALVIFTFWAAAQGFANLMTYDYCLIDPPMSDLVHETYTCPEES